MPTDTPVQEALQLQQLAAEAHSLPLLQCCTQSFLVKQSAAKSMGVSHCLVYINMFFYMCGMLIDIAAAKLNGSSLKAYTYQRANAYAEPTAVLRKTLRGLALSFKYDQNGSVTCAEKWR